MKKKFMFFDYLMLFVIISLIGCAGKNVSPLPAKGPPVYKEAKEYYIQPGDNLDIKFFYNPELNENVTVRPDGKISLQLLDEIQAAGLTPARLDEILTKKYSSELKQTSITVILRSFEGQKIYVGGEVNSPQVINIVGRVNVLQAIFDAGGFKADAKLSNVMIISRDPDHRPLVREVNLEKALEGEFSEGEYLLKPFDIVYVPKTRLGKVDLFITHIYRFIPPNIGLGFGYELHNEPTKSR